MADVPYRSFIKGWFYQFDHLVGLDGFSYINNFIIKNSAIEPVRGWKKLILTPVENPITHRFSTYPLSHGIKKITEFIKDDIDTEQPTSFTIIKTTLEVYYFDRDYNVIDITPLDDDPQHKVPNDNPVVDGQFKNIYISTDNFRRPKKWDGIAGSLSNLQGLADLTVSRAVCLEVNNNHVIFANVTKILSDVQQGTLINNVNIIINTLDTSPEDLINNYGRFNIVTYQKFNKTIMWSDVNNAENYTPTISNEAGDMDIDEDGYAIVRIKRMGELNIVYKEHSIWYLIYVGLPFVYVKKFYTAFVGLLAVNAIIEINNIHYFVGSDFNIYSFDGTTIINLSKDHGIQDYIKQDIDNDNIFKTHCYLDTEERFIHFVFHARPRAYNYPKFDIVYDYNNKLFFKQNNISETGGIFREAEDDKLINEITDIINDRQEIINVCGVTAIPNRKILIGDSNGYVYLFNESDSFDGQDIVSEIVTGDENYEGHFKTRKGVNNNSTSKLMTQIRVLLEKTGKNFNISFEVGTRNSLDNFIKWHGPYNYNTDSNGLIDIRADGLYHRLRIKSLKKYQHFRLLGYTPRVVNNGEVIR